MINWTVFKSNMTSYLSSAVAPDTKSFVIFFLTQFDLAMRTGTNINGNLILKTNLEIALTTTTAAMELQKVVNETLSEVNQNIDMVLDSVLVDEINKVLKLTNSGISSTESPSNDSVIIKQVKSLISVILSPIIKGIVKTLTVGTMTPDQLRDVIKSGIDKDKIKKDVKEQFGTVDKTFEIIAGGISLTLMLGNLLPIPPIPPTVLPNYAVPLPCSILFPGDIKSLAKDLKTSLSDDASIKTPALTCDLLQLALQKYLMTVGGLYFGLLPIGAVMVPAPPIPWLGLN